MLGEWTVLFFMWRRFHVTGYLITYVITTDENLL